MSDTNKPKARRKLKDIDFSVSGAHVALTHKDQGFSANGKPVALVLKAASKEFVEKIQQIQVTLELPEFLRRFYDMYWDDADSLAALLGYVRPQSLEEPYDYEADYNKYLEEKIQGYVIIKSLKDSSDLNAAIAALPEEDILNILKAQEKIEPLMESKAVAKATTEDNTSQIGTEVEEDEVITSVVKQANEENSMTTEVKTVEQEVTVEMVEKSQFELVQKALEEQKAALQKAMETIAQFEAEKKEAIVKAKTAKLAEAVDAKHLEIVAKAALALEADADFDAFVSAMQEMKQAVEKSALFEEQGASGESEEIVKESGVAKILKAKLQSK
jgi:hypothetical protein